MSRLDRTEHIEDVFNEIRKLANNDMRIGQVFECIRTKHGNDLFNMENDKLLKELKKFTEGM